LDGVSVTVCALQELHVFVVDALDSTASCSDIELPRGADGDSTCVIALIPAFRDGRAYEITGLEAKVLLDLCVCLSREPKGIWIGSSVPPTSRCLDD
jgi:hypothetical protein